MKARLEHLIYSIGIVVLLVFPAVHSSNVIAKPVPSTLVIGNGADPGSLNPFSAMTTSDFQIIENIFEGLMTHDKNHVLQPSQAEQWTVSEDGKVYTFKLRSDLKWSNGDPLTARDFVFAMRYAVNPANAQVRSDAIQSLNILNARRIIAGELEPDQIGVKALNDTTLQVELEKPVPYALDSMSHVLLPLHQPSIEEHGEKWSQPGNLISNGAYTLETVVINEYTSIVKNPHYRNSASVQIPRAVFLPLQPESELKRYQAGEIHIASSIAPTMYDRLKTTIPDEIIQHPIFATYFYQFNLKDEKFKDKQLRKALSLAIDRSVITKFISKQGQQPAYFFTPPNTNDFQTPDLPELSQSQSERNKEAQRLYQSAGFNKDNPLEVEILYNTRESHRQIALAISDMWKRTLGVETRLRNQEFNSMITDVRQGKFEVSRIAWMLSDPEPCMMLDIFTSGHKMNDSGYTNPAFDQLIQQACTGNRTPELQKTRLQLFNQLEQILADDVPAIPIYFASDVKLVKPEVGGYPASGEFGLFRIKDLYFKTSD